MNANRRLLLGGGVLIALMVLISIIAYPEMPAQMATHWNGSGDVNGTMPRLLGLSILPIIALFTLGLFLVLPRIDPRDNFDAFRFAYDALALTTVALFGYVHVLVVLVNAGYTINIIQAISPAIGAIYVVAGFVTVRADQNWFVGVRTPWTLESETVWDKTNTIVGRLFEIGGIVTALGFFFPTYAIALILIPALVVALVSFGYSWWAYQRIGHGV